MSVRCDECGLAFPETGEEFRRAARRPDDWCSCPTNAMQVYAQRHSDIFATGYANADAWREKFL